MSLQDWLVFLLPFLETLVTQADKNYCNTVCSCSLFGGTTCFLKPRAAKCTYTALVVLVPSEFSVTLIYIR
jgi:hypothetical protein